MRRPRIFNPEVEAARIKERRRIAMAISGVCLLALLLIGVFPGDTWHYSDHESSGLFPASPDPLGHFEGSGAQQAFPGQVTGTELAILPLKEAPFCHGFQASTTREPVPV